MYFLRTIASVSTLIVTPLMAPTAIAQDVYPSKPIKLIVPFPPGGTTDLLARVLADKLPKLLGQPVIVENRAGAGGVIGTEVVARAPNDGYTLGMATASTHGVNPAVYSKISYDAGKEFAPITRIASVPNVMVINAAMPAKSLKEFVELASRQPGKYSFASPGSGSVGHALGELFKMTANVDLVHIPYKGAGPALNDVIGGQVQVLYDNLPTSLLHIKAGKLRALAIAAPKRVSAAPDIPTFAELGMSALNESAWFGVVAPAGTPNAILTKLHVAIDAAMKQPDVIDRLDKMGAQAMVESPQAFSTHITKEIAQFKRVAQAANIRAE
jgi:tripartite-type tricarboxylate transporter receptor subunit TctC